MASGKNNPARAFRRVGRGASTPADYQCLALCQTPAERRRRPQAGLRPAYVSAQLGHTDATTTLRWYARWIPRTDKRAVDALDEPRLIKKLRLEAAQGGTVGDRSAP